MLKRLETAEKLKELDDLRRIVDAIPPEITAEIIRRDHIGKQKEKDLRR